MSENAKNQSLTPEEIVGILNANQNKQFVRRILYPKDYPAMQWSDKDVATHRMAWGELSPGRYAVFPTIVYDKGTLSDMGEKSFRHAIETGQYVEFDNPEQASDFSEHYKKYWDTIGFTPDQFEKVQR